MKKLWWRLRSGFRRCELCWKLAATREDAEKLMTEHRLCHNCWLEVM